MECQKKHLEVNGQKVSDMTGDKMSISERPSLSEVKTSLCEGLYRQIVQQFKNNVSQHKIAKNLGISSSTYIITLKENLEKSLYARERLRTSICWL